MAHFRTHYRAEFIPIDGRVPHGSPWYDSLKGMKSFVERVNAGWKEPEFLKDAKVFKMTRKCDDELVAIYLSLQHKWIKL